MADAAPRRPRSTAAAPPVRLLIRLSGTRPAEVESFGEQAGYAALGLSMLVVGAVQFVSARIFLTLVLDGRALRAISAASTSGSGAAALMRNLGYSPAAAVWALLVYALELSITSQITGSDPSREARMALAGRGRLRGRWGRVALAVAFGVVISEMIVQLLFASSFTTLVAQSHARANAQALARARTTDSGAAATGLLGPDGQPAGAYKALLDQRKPLADQVEVARQRYACELSGNVSTITKDPATTVDCTANPGTGHPGYQGVATARMAEYTAAKRALADWDSANQKELADFTQQARAVEGNSASLLESEQNSIDNDDGFGPRLDASIDYLEVRPWTRVPTRLALLLAGVLLDLVPLIIKGGLAGSVYDVRRRRARRTAVLDEIAAAEKADTARRLEAETAREVAEERDRRRRARLLEELDEELPGRGSRRVAGGGENGGSGPGDTKSRGTPALPPPDLRTRGARASLGAVAPLAARTRRVDPVTRIATPLADLRDVGPYAGRVFTARGRSFQAETMLADEQQGSYGTVYVGKEIGGEGILVAIKVVDPRRASTEAYRVAYKREIAPRRAHPGLAPLLASGQLEDGAVFSIVPWYQNTLADWDQENKASVKIAAVVRFTAQVAEGLAALCPSVHNDVHPRNVAIDGSRAIVFDFGLTRRPRKARDSALKASFAPAGTLYFSAPERLFDGDTGDETTEVYSLYALLYWCLVGVPPLWLEAGREGIDRSVDYEVRRFCFRPDIERFPVAGCLPRLPEGLAWLAELVDRRLSTDRGERIAGLRADRVLEDARDELADAYARLRGVPAGHLRVAALDSLGRREDPPADGAPSGRPALPGGPTRPESESESSGAATPDADVTIPTNETGPRRDEADDVTLVAAAEGLPERYRTAVEAPEADGLGVTPSLTLLPGGGDQDDDTTGPEPRPVGEGG